MGADEQVERVTSVAVGSDRAVKPWWVRTTCCLAIFLIGLNTTAINASRDVLAAFGLAIASALSLSVASGSFRAGIAADGLPAAEEEDLETALTGTDSGLNQAIDSVGAGSRASVEAAAQSAITDGFRAAMALMAAIAFVSAIISLLMLPGRRRA